MQTLQTRTRWTIRDMSFCSLFAALIAAGAFMQITIPIQPFPMHFTLQWFFVLLAAFLLGHRLATYSVCIYLAIGLVGIPVFASGGGPSYLIRPTFGFLLGFALAAWVTGFVKNRLHSASFFAYLLSATAGLLVMYLSGMLYFYMISNFVIFMPVTWKIVFINCCLITIGGDFVLCLLAATLAKRLQDIMHYL
ncbi:MAG: biotin transporter BioY [bacterium]|nr:biotin transporter BioY [bacterium]